MRSPIPKLTTVQARRVLRNLDLPDGATVRYGVHCDGAGPARRGWARYSAGGDCIYLGRSAIGVILDPGPADVCAAIDLALKGGHAGRWRGPCVVECPHCGGQWAMRHGAFFACVCLDCRREVEKRDLLLPRRSIQPGDWR